MTVSESRQKTAGPVLPAAPMPLQRSLKHLSARQIYAIDEALSAIGAFGEVRLVKNRGRLRFIQTVRSEDLGASEDPEPETS